MKIVVTAEGGDLEAPASPRFGRCPVYIFIETETLAFEALPNPALSASGGAGIQAAQFIVEQDARAVLTSNVGPNAMDVLRVADIPVYLLDGGSVREAVEDYRSGRLRVATQANVQAHAGVGGGRRTSIVSRMGAREVEVAALREKAAELRQELADVIKRIDKLEKEN